MTLQTVKGAYFTYKTDSMNGELERVVIRCGGLDDILQRIAAGGSLINCVQGLKGSRPQSFPLRYGYFERREVDIDGERIVSEKPYERVGRFLVPYNKVLTREDFEQQATDSAHKSVLKEFTRERSFCETAKGYIPVRGKDVLVLQEDQLRKQ